MTSLSCLNHVLDYRSPLPPSSSITCSRTLSAIVCVCINMAVLCCLDITTNILLILRTRYLGYGAASTAARRMLSHIWWQRWDPQSTDV